MGQIALDTAAMWQTADRLRVADELEIILETLDGIGAHIAAAHIDVAILRLREEVADKQKVS